MKIKLYQVVFENHEKSHHAHYWQIPPGSDCKDPHLYREIEVEVPDLPDKAAMDAFIAQIVEANKPARIAQLKAELSALGGSA